MNDHDPLRELNAAEAAARDVQQPVLKRFQGAYGHANEALRLYAADMERRAGRNQQDVAARAHLVLLPCLADDLRAVWLVASSGYWLQATTLASATLEVAATIGFLGLRHERAEKWLFWSKYDKTPWPVAALIDGAVAHWKGQPDPTASQTWKTWYTLFSRAKHANPSLQTRIIGSLTPADHVIGLTPEVVPKTEFRLWMTLYSSLQLTVFGSAALLAVDQGAPDEVREAIRQLLSAMTTIAKGEEGMPLP